MNSEKNQNADFNRLLVFVFHLDLDSQVLAWQHEIVRGLAHRSREVVVLTEKIGRTSLGANVKVITVPQLLQRFPFRLLGLKWLMLMPLALELRRGFDAALFHMNFSWAYRVGPLLRLSGIPTVLWYAHGTIPASLRLALPFIDRVLTSSPDGFRLPTEKLKVIGQGVDTDTFAISSSSIPIAPSTDLKRDIVYVGRLSPSKNLELVISSFASLLQVAPRSARIRNLLIIGATPSRRDEWYLDKLRSLIADLNLGDRVVLTGQRNKLEIAANYTTNALVHLNLSDTGSMDKSVLESLAAGCPVITSNSAYRELLGRYPELILSTKDPEQIARQIVTLIGLIDSGVIDGQKMRAIVLDGGHAFPAYLDRVSDSIKELL